MFRSIAIASALSSLLLTSLPGGSELASEIEQPQNERQWSAQLAEKVGGETEHQLPDGSRIDILTDDVAWEVEWSDHWEESIGQSSYYAMATDRKAGVWLLLRGKHDKDYLRCLMVCRQHGIELKTQKTH